MAVVAVHRDRNVGGNTIDQLARRQHRRAPLGFVPVAALHPLALRRVRRPLADAPRELPGVRDFIELHRIERGTPPEKMHMGIVETGHQALARRVDDLGGGPPPLRDVGVAADRDDPAVQHGDGLRLGIPGIARPDLGAADDEVGRGSWDRGRGCGHKRRYDKCGHRKRDQSGIAHETLRRTRKKQAPSHRRYHAWYLRHQAGSARHPNRRAARRRGRAPAHSHARQPGPPGCPRPGHPKKPRCAMVLGAAGDRIAYAARCGSCAVQG